MEVELLKLNESRNINDLRNYVSTLSASSISEGLPKIVWKNDGAPIIQALFDGLSESAACVEKKLLISEAILFEIEKKQLPACVSEKLVNVLAGEVDSFSTAHLLRLADVCCDMIRNPNKDSNFSCWKELLPKLLYLIVKKPWVDHGGSQMTGEEFKFRLISSLCMSDWSSTIAVSLAAIFSNMPLSKEEKDRVVKKLCATLPSLQPDEIPPFTHQLMTLTKNEHSVSLFIALAHYFKTNLYDKLDQNFSTQTELRRLTTIGNVEGTVLYHIVNDHGPLGLKDLLKVFKQCQNVSQFVLQPFNVTLLLALASTSPASEEEVLSILRTSLARALTENERFNESAWLRSVLPKPVDVSGLINRVLENCFRSRDFLMKGIIIMGFNLLTAGRGAENLNELGIKILEDLVKKNKVVASIVLETLETYFSQAADSSQYAECLIVLSRKQPLSMSECTAPMKQLLESCDRLPTKTAIQILTALLPLARISHTIRDNLVILLRKSLFPHDVDHQIMGIAGFLELLRDLKISNLQNLSQSMSQNFCNMSQLCSQSLYGAASQSNEGLCLEVLSILSGALKQQHQVKTIVYKGIYSAVRANPELGSHSLDFLQTHLCKWFDPDTTAPPLRFNDAVVIENDEAILREPLGDFILCLGLLVAKLEDNNRSLKLMDKFDVICSRMTASSVSSFNLEMMDGSSILDANAEANQKQEILRQVLGVYEALMGYLLCSWNKRDTDKSDRFLNLFKSYMVVCDYARGLGKLEKKKNEKRQKIGEKVKVFRFPNTVLNFKCCARLLTIINSNASNNESALLKGKRELHRYATQVTVQVIRDAQALSPTELARDCHSLGYLCSLGRTLFKSYVARIAEAKAFDLPAAFTGLQAFADLLNLIISHFKPKLQNFLNEIAGEATCSQDVNSLHSVLNKLLDQLDDVLAEEAQEEDGKEEQQAKKMPVLYLAVVSCLVQEVAAGSPFALQAYEKIDTICRERKFERPAAAKAMLTLLLILHRRYEASYSLMTYIALSLCSNMELIDAEMEIEDHVEYKIVNHRTANVCLVALCDALLLHIADIEWTVNRLKAEAVTLAYPSEEPTENRLNNLRSWEINLCRHLQNCSRVLSEICTIAVPPGVYSDSVLKCLETMYCRLLAITKYFMVRVTKFQEDLTLTRFDKTVRMVDSQLTKNMYCFTEHVLADGISDAKGGNPTLLKQRVLKETKLIPKVVLAKEQYHKFLLQLSKRSKIDLSSKTKHTLARDYRLFTREVKELLVNEHAEPQSDLMETDLEGSSQPSSPVPTKRQRSMVIEDENSRSSP